MKQRQREDDNTEEDHRRFGDVDGVRIVFPRAKTTGHQVGSHILLQHNYIEGFEEKMTILNL